MGLPNGAIQAFGIGGGIILSYMMIPQIVQVYRTRRADDLSHSFMLLYNFGLLCLCFYNVWLELWVFAVACALQLILGVVVQGLKFWADRHQRKEAARRGRLAHSLSLKSGALEDLAEFTAGTAAPFPLLRPQPSHAAQHLLLDARLPAAVAAAPAEGSDAAAAPDTFGTVVGLLQDALADAGVLKGPPRLIPASGCSERGAGAQAEAAGAAAEGPSASELLMCTDGYVAATWHAETAGLSVDCLAVSESSMHGMAAAAEAFCAALLQRYPGARIAASTLGRLPAA